MHHVSLAPWSHDHVFGLDRRRAGESRTRLVAALTLAAMAVEIVAGMATGSMALLADGLHMGSHAAAIGVSAYAYAFARWHARDPAFCFGTGKIDALAGFASAVLLAAFAAAIGVESLIRVVAPQPIGFDAALAVAAAGLVVNIVSAFLLGAGHDHAHHVHDGHPDHAHAHGPGPGHGHEHPHGTGSQGAPEPAGRDHALTAAYLHVLADALTSALAIAALLTGKYAGLVWLDPAVGLLGAAMIARWAWSLLRTTAAILVDRRAPEAVLDRLRAAIETGSTDRIADLHVWAIGHGLHAAALAIVSDDPREPEDYRRLIPAGLGVVHATIEVNRCRAPAGARQAA